MKETLLRILLVCLLSNAVFGQKDAPLAGQAATLVDLLKKDYNGIDPDLRSDEMIKDRALVISIYKSYLTDFQRGHLISRIDGLEDPATNVKAYLDTLNISKKNAATANTILVNPVSNLAIEAIITNSSAISSSIEKQKALYLAAKSDLDIAELELVMAEYKNESNEYLVYTIGLFVQKYKQLKKGNDSFAATNYSSAITKSIPFIGGELAFETVIDGLSRFLAKRIKEELTSEVLVKVQKWLDKEGEADPLAEFKVILPRTTQYLRDFEPEKITSFPDEIKQYIEDDLNHALEHAGDLRNTPRIRKLIEGHPDLDFAMEAIEMIPNLSKLKNPADYFKTIENSRNLRRWKKHGNLPIRFNIAHLIQLSSMIGQSMVIIDNGEVRFAGKEFMGTYVGEKNFYLLYLGFLYQQNIKYYQVEFQYRQTAGRANMVLANELKIIISRPVQSELTDERRFFNFMLTGIGDNAEKVLASATEIRKANKAGKKVGADTVFKFLESMINLSENVVFAGGALVDYLEISHAEYLPRIRENKASLDRIAAPYFMVARSFNEVAFDMQKRKYANALIKVLELREKLADEAVLSDKDISARVALFDEVHLYPTINKWPKVLAYIKTPGTDFRTVSQKCDTVLNDLKYIVMLGRNIYGTKITAEFTALLKKAECIKKLDVENRTNKAKVLEGLLGKPEFFKVVVAYYTGIYADSVITLEEIGPKRKRYPFCGKDNNYDNSQIAEINEAANKHVKTLTAFLITGQETDQMLSTKMALEEKVRTYLHSFNVSLRESPNSQIISLIHFINDMAVAEKSEDVEKAIEAFALPAGSYAIKRKSVFNFSINCFPGILPAIESPWKKDETQNLANPGASFTLGFTAPVGFAGSWGYYGRSYGFFISVIDIGAITRLRLDNDKNTTTLPKLTFENFLAPGIYFHWGFKNSPLSLNFGTQFGPEMRKFNTKDDFVSYDSMRFGVGLVLDIPLLNLHTKPAIKDL